VRRTLVARLDDVWRNGHEPLWYARTRAHVSTGAD
jgi:hypothetical protein